MSVKTKEDLTDKMRKVVEEYWRLYEANGEEPSNYEVANGAYDNCADSMVYYTKTRYPHLFDGDRRVEEISVTILSLMRGDAFDEGSYQISYNDDREGNWWLRFEESGICHIASFSDVEMFDEDSYGLIRDGTCHLTIDGIRNQAPTIARVLDLLSRA